MSCFGEFIYFVQYCDISTMNNYKTKNCLLNMNNSLLNMKNNLLNMKNNLEIKLFFPRRTTIYPKRCRPHSRHFGSYKQCKLIGTRRAKVDTVR